MNKHVELFLESARGAILGKENEIKMALCCFLSHGHLLIEDAPGMGKTTFAKTMAKLLDLSFARIQFTNDLMPSDLIGIQIFDAKENKFKLIPGPIFHQFILADELNRGTPKTQSALLEAMEERQVTLDGMTIELPAPFFVVATQNPRAQIGTHSLPESQLDRFMMKIKLGYPDSDNEKKIISEETHLEHFANLEKSFSEDELSDLQDSVKKVTVTEKLLSYVVELLQLSRTDNRFRGLSPRAGKDIVKAARAWAYLSGRDYVLPDDVQEILAAVISHRLAPDQSQSFDQDEALSKMLIRMVAVD